eukprot:TRINITY_DN61705_c0_g1_i1.p1 TRINITY_DN61705_c0_g1~~TRINITY_DN61705_c0_g1_i1.p1  ORF type:complete len:338 (-),score=52.91 TRINITY_DN61705_c0_g1_i1:114-1127(-)
MSATSALATEERGPSCNAASLKHQHAYDGKPALSPKVTVARCIQCRKNQAKESRAAYGIVLHSSTFDRQCEHGPFCARCCLLITQRVLPACTCRAMIDSWQESAWPTSQLMMSGEVPRCEEARVADSPKQVANGHAQLKPHSAPAGEVLKTGLNGLASSSSNLPSQNIGTLKVESTVVEAAAARVIVSAAAGEDQRRSADTSLAAADRAVATAAAGEDERRLAETPLITAASDRGALTALSELDDGKESKPQFKRFRSNGGSVRTGSCTDDPDDDMGSAVRPVACSLHDPQRRIVGEAAPSPVKLRTVRSSGLVKKPDTKQKIRITAGCSDEEGSND